jgi:acyl carrier protein
MEKKKLSLIAELLEKESVQPYDSLSNFPLWDSMTSLSLIVLLEEQFNKTDIDADTLSELKTVNDILKLME